MRAAIILKDADFTKFNRNDYDIVIGADKGALHAIQNGVNPDISVGDFDSVSQEEYEFIKKNSLALYKLNPIKDMSDTNEAISMCKDYDEIEILGGIQGKRIEHLFANIIDLINNPNLLLKDANTLIETTDALKQYHVREGYKFISIYAIEETILTLKGFKYNLKDYVMKTNDPLGLSNEPIDHPEILIQKGRVLVIYSYGD